jgi:beta-lactamase regulating signal transducer with metallopeptidase domain
MLARAWTDVSLRFLGEVTLRATALLLVALIAGWALRRAAAGTRRQLWAGTVVALLLLPVLAAALPRLPVLPMPAASGPTEPAFPPGAAPLAGWRSGGRWPWRNDALLNPFGPLPTAGSARPSPTNPAAEANDAQPAAPSPAGGPGLSPFATTLVGLYLLGLAVALRRLIKARRTAARVLRGARRTEAPWHVPGDVQSRESDAVALPQTLGSWRPVVLLPRAGRDWPEGWRAAVVAHEVAHVRGRDPLWQLLGEIACAIYWFHPLAHLALRQLRIERELAADDATLAAGLRPSDYARVLFELACIPERPAALGAVVPLLTPGGLKARIRALLEPGRPRRSARTAAVVMGALGLSTLLPLAAAVPSRPERPAAGASAWVVGRVVDPQGAPVAGALVNFRPDRGRWFGAGDVPPAQTVLSDDEGWVRYPEQMPRQPTFDVYVRKGRLAMRKEIMAIKYGTALPTTLDLRPARALSGTIRDDDGRPVGGATVRILEDRQETPGPGPQVLARSDANGSWRIEGMLYGQFALLAQAPWGVATTFSTTIDTKDVSGLDCEVARQWPVSGYLQDEHGRPLAGVRVEQDHMFRISSRDPRPIRMGPGERHFDWDESADDGSFRMLAMGRRVHMVARDADGRDLFGDFVDPSQPVFFSRIGGGLARPTLPVRAVGPAIVTLRRSPRLSGHVRASDGSPIAGAVVTAGAAMFTGSTVTYPQASTTTDARGAFSLSVPATTIQLTAYAPGADGAPRRTQFSLMMNPGDARDDIVLTLGPL